MTRVSRASLAALLVAFFALPGRAAGVPAPNYDHVDTSRWRCRLCPFELATAARGSWRAETLAVADGHARFGRDNGLERAGVRGNGDACYAIRASDGRRFEFDGADLGLDARQLRLAAGEAGGSGIVLQWREMPHHVGTADDYVGTADDYVGTADDYVGTADDYVGTADELTAAGDRAFDYATKRRRRDATVAVAPTPSTRLEANYVREAKTGLVETYADRLYRATGLAKPVAHTTEELGGRAAYSSPTWLLAAEVRRLWFRNANKALEWGAGQASRVALAPDNDADTVSLIGRAALGRTRLHANATWAWQRQHDAFLPYTRNEALQPPPLPSRGLDGNVRNFAAAAHLDTRITRRLRFDFGHRERERINTTPTLLFTPVLADLVVMLPLENRAYSIRQRDTRGRIRYRLGSRATIAVGARSSWLQRQPAEIAENDERDAWFDITARLGGGFAAAVRAGQATRKASAFEPSTRNNPRTRRYHQAARTQERMRARIDYRPKAIDAAFGFAVDWTEDVFPDALRGADSAGSQLGLRRNRDRGWSAEAALAPSAKLSLSAFHDVRNADSATGGYQAYPSADWRYATADRTRTTGLRVRARGLAHPRLDVDVAFNQSRGRGQYETAVQNDAYRFPDLVSDHRSLALTVAYRLRPRTAVALRWYREEYASADWALADVAPTTMRNVLAFGRSAPNYANSYVGVSLQRRLPFGESP